MAETPYSVGEGPATSPEGTAEAIRQRVGKRGSSAFITAAVERELRGQILDEYLADYERRKGPLPTSEQERARQVFDEVFAKESQCPDPLLSTSTGTLWTPANEAECNPNCNPLAGTVLDDHVRRQRWLWPRGDAVFEPR